MVYEPTRVPKLFGIDDLPWIAKLLDIVEQSLGEPWRVLVERVEHAPLGVHASHRTVMLGALRRVLVRTPRSPTGHAEGVGRRSGGARDGRKENDRGLALEQGQPPGGSGQRARVARQVRALVLGAPALDPGERDARLAAAADKLGVAPQDVESLLWIDLAMERPVALPSGRPREEEVAAYANLEQIQRCVRRAHELQLRVWDRANELVRTVARYGLIAQIRCEDGATVLDVIGPLALFHSTIVYGRALASLVPLLADHARFELDIDCRFAGEQAHVTVAPPVLLPPVQVSSRRAPSIAERLAGDLAALGHAVEREPPPIASGEHLLFPDLAVERGGGRWLIEVLGFSTSEYLLSKLARYRAAGINRVVLCVDLTNAPGCAPSPQICSFFRWVDVDDLLALLRAWP